MNSNELILHLSKKDKKISKGSSIAYVTLPLILISEKILARITILLEEKYSISTSELDVLSSLHSSVDEKHTLSPTKLYERLFFSSGGMTKVLKKLDAKGFIKRLDNKEDKRSKLVRLTKSGKEIVEKSLSDVIALEEKMFSHVNTKDRASLSELLFKTLDGTK
ncbi:MAG: MarR family transcriptional regulator [Sulfurimonas sp.]|uniref:MarR family winged helix-turn-helix transcriptional regulator n=1 Tax=Sulfurimonas sp. TaxID=2022749 RepID=UPI0025EC884C|nr:MarR family transcriptional regulator [Sulfurimonas sp.]MCK9491456.1 MarR family transcriptional regulator [Sulfurimonas sp.]